MNAKETGMVLEMITAHYWQTPKTAERNAELMVRTWQKALADIPLQPHIELALDDWFKNEKWPPQVAELRERALELGGPTPAMMAEAQAWNERQQYGRDLDSGAVDIPEHIGGDDDYYHDVKALAMDEFWRKRRVELGLPDDQKALSSRAYALSAGRGLNPNSAAWSRATGKPVV